MASIKYTWINSLVIVSAEKLAIHVLAYSFINAKNVFKCLMHIIKFDIITNFTSLTLQHFRLPIQQPAGLPTVRPSSTMARAPVFLHKKGNRVGFTKPLFRRTFIHSTMVFPLSFISQLSSSNHLQKSEKLANRC